MKDECTDTHSVTLTLTLTSLDSQAVTAEAEYIENMLAWSSWSSDVGYVIDVRGKP